MTFKDILRQLDELIMPRLCAFCGTPCLASESSACAGCLADLPYNEVSCPRCALPLGSERAVRVECGRCQQRPPPFSHAVAPLCYTFPVDAAIKALKFHRRLFYVPVFAELLCTAFARLPAGADALLPVPLHWRRHVMRGFNQSQELCKPLQRLTGLAVLCNVQRVRPTPFQSGLEARERRRNLRSVFRVKGLIHAQHVVIVDDVITTGETASALARVLLRAGVDKVSVLAVARVADPAA